MNDFNIMIDENNSEEVDLSNEFEKFVLGFNNTGRTSRQSKSSYIFSNIDKQRWINSEAFDAEFVKTLNYLSYWDIREMCSNLPRKTSLNKDLESFWFRISKYKDLEPYIKIYLFINYLCNLEDIIPVYLEKDTSGVFYSNVSRRMSLEGYKRLTKSKDSNIRTLSYYALPIEENIDNMLNDRSKDVRIIALRHLKFGDKRFKQAALKEKAGQNLIEIAKKLSYKDLVFLVGKKARSKWTDSHIKKLVQKRMEERC